MTSEMTEPKQEPPEDDRESPLIRVCDTPSSTRSLQSPGLDHHHSPDQSSPAPGSTLPMFPPIFPPMMFLNPYLGLPLQRFPSLPLPPILPPHLQHHNETKPKSTLPFTIDNILKSVPRSVSLSPPVKMIKDTGSPRPVSKTRSMSPEDTKPESPLMGDTPPGVTKDAECHPGMGLLHQILGQTVFWTKSQEDQEEQTGRFF